MDVDFPWVKAGEISILSVTEQSKFLQPSPTENPHPY
jgi:hypothetical protein